VATLCVASFTIMSQRDIERFERLILPHLDDAYTLARYLLRDEHDAQDVVQEATLRALRYFDGYAGGDSRAWLLSIVRHSVADFARKERAWDTDAGATDSLVGAEQTDALAIENSERERVRRAVRALPEEFREVIVLREIEELSYKEISAVVGVPIGTVMSRLARARSRLAALLGRPAEEAS
jgi:RNA polymerase sigma factor (sigma-70 family)